MSRFKKNLILSIIVLIAISSVICFIYLFNQFQQQQDPTKLLADLEVARKNIEIETKRLTEIREKSYFFKISNAEYLKTKDLISKIDIFFKNPESSHPEIQLKTQNMVIETEINAKRLKITEILNLWNDNNLHSMETDQKLIEEIRVYLLIIKEYSEQLKNIVANLSEDDSGLTLEQINSYKKIVSDTTKEIDKIIITIKETQIIISEAVASTTKKEDQITEKQIEVIKKIQETIVIIENKLDKVPPISTTTTTVTSQEATSTDLATSTDTTTKRPRIINHPKSEIIYTANPIPFKDNGVDVNTSNIISPLQDW